MPVGDSEAALYTNKGAILLTKTFGAKGLHDHLRIAPLREYARKHLRGRPLSVLEVGCGEGLSLFELGKVLGPEMTADGYDCDPEDIRIAQRIAAQRFPNINFHCADATEVTETRNDLDVILLMDFLEHVQEPAAIVSKLARCLKAGGVMIVSVPTPRYPVVFTRAMHERIGHRVDGYTEQSLQALFPPAFAMTFALRNTGFPAQYGCWLQTRSQRFPYLLDWIKDIIFTSIFRKLDWLNGPKSCSLFAVFTKTG